MRKWLLIAGGSMMVTACGGGGAGGSGAVAVVSGTPSTTPTPTPSPTPTPAPAPTPTPAPAPTPTPTPTSSYPRFADLTGSRTFQTACASLMLGSGGLPTPQPATPFGDGLTLDGGTSGGWTVSGEGIGLSFAATDAVTAAAGQRAYERTVGGAVQRLTITDPVAAGTTLTYARSFALRTDGAPNTALYSCVFGVPTTLADRPTAAISYGKVGVTGTAYVADQNGAVQTYSLTASTGTVSYDATAGAQVVKMRLIGAQAGGGTTELGTFTGSGAVDTARGKFGGQLDTADRISLFSSFGGWFFGGAETASAFEVLAMDPATGNRMAVVGTVYAAQ